MVVLAVLIGIAIVVGLLVFAFVGGLACAVWLDELTADSEPDPYREGLDASARVTAMAFEAERMMHQIAHEEPPKE